MPQYRSKRREVNLPPITQDDVFFLLEPLVGLPLLLKHSELSSEIAELLGQYSWHSGDSLEELFRQIESSLFNSVYGFTNGKMVVKDEQGHQHKIYTDSLSQMAELLLDPLFERFPRCERTFTLFNDYALRHLSLPAIKRIFTDYPNLVEPMNRAIFERILIENFAKETYEDWLMATEERA